MYQISMCGKKKKMHCRHSMLLDCGFVASGWIYRNSQTNGFQSSTEGPQSPFNEEMLKINQ